MDADAERGTLGGFLSSMLGGSPTSGLPNVHTMAEPDCDDDGNPVWPDYKPFTLSTGEQQP